MNKRQLLYLYIMFALVFNLACGLPSLTSTPVPPVSSTVFVPTTLPQEEISENSTAAPEVTSGIPITSNMKPVDTVPASGKLIYDVESSGTAAPYGDSYKLNRFERPFLKDMTYVSDIDIVTFNLSQDSDWYYISIELSGNDPNNPLGINYGVEIDLDADGFGDYIIWAQPPYTTLWDKSTVQIFKDSNHDTGGVSGLASDALVDSNGYDTLVFDGGTSQNADPDLAWVRVSEGLKVTIQFAFKQSLTGPRFMLGVVSDAGLKDISKFDYNDHFQEAEAGSPVQSKTYYPLGSLYAVDNTCWEAYGIEVTGYEPKLCQTIAQPTPSRQRQDGDSEDGTDQIPAPSGCDPLACGGSPYDPVTCDCT